MSLRSRFGLRRTSGDRGATLVLVVLMMVVMLIAVAAVIDLSFIRQNRQADKSAADFAAAAGIRELDNGLGQVQPWKGICAARDYLLANNDELAGASWSFLNGLDNTLGIDACAAPPITVCVNGTPATWGKLVGSADDGRIRVTIQNGYSFSSSGFSEDTEAYSGDTGDGACDNLAVIVEEGEPPYFGGIVGATGYETTMRSVARLDQPDGEVAAALILLERHDCRALNVAGTNAIVQVGGTGTAPGVIHADSLGDGADCSYIYRVNASPPPRIIAEAGGPSSPGEISSFALTGPPGESDNVSAGTTAVCAKLSDGTCTGPSPRPLIGRRVGDIRYREPIIELRDDAEEKLSATSIDDPDLSGYTEVACDDPIPTDEDIDKVWVNCDGGTFNGNGKSFGENIDEVVINGSVNLTGTGNTLEFHSPTKLYIRGTSGNAVSASSNNIVVNQGDFTDQQAVGEEGHGFVCDDRPTNSYGETTKMVVGTGRVQMTGGTLRLCGTALLMMDTDDSELPPEDCEIPPIDGLEPQDNDCQGNISVTGGSSVIDWTAPNVATDYKPDPGDAEYDDLEDLALWSETQGGPGPSSWSIGGSGGLHLGGIYITPNADPVTVTGGGFIDIRDAQFLTRKLNAAGNGTLFMEPDPNNSLTIPELTGFRLVR